MRETEDADKLHNIICTINQSLHATFPFEETMRT